MSHVLVQTGFRSLFKLRTLSLKQRGNIENQSGFIWRIFSMKFYEIFSIFANQNFLEPNSQYFRKWLKWRTTARALGLINIRGAFEIFISHIFEGQVHVCLGGAQQDLAQPETQLTPLHRAAARGHAMCLQQLLHTYVADGFILRLTRDP